MQYIFYLGLGFILLSCVLIKKIQLSFKCSIYYLDKSKTIRFGWFQGGNNPIVIDDIIGSDKKFKEDKLKQDYLIQIKISNPINNLPGI
jgi:hypothetical protein